MLARSNNHRPPLVIALVNNMAPAAKLPTEEQFTRLLTAASQTLNVHFSLSTIENLPVQSDDILDLLRKSRADGLIVTGAEPRSVAMTDEPFWPALAKLVDWASDNTISSVWSCLAAHAAAFRLDQIHRKPLPQKLSGVFTCTKATDHPLLRDTPSRWPVPHSRSNSLDEAELRSKGYTVLSHAPRVGVDSFAKQIRSSLFLLLQGHPEYGSDSLLSEYRRDVRRFLNGQRNGYPDTPEGYFSQDTTRTLAGLREQASRRPSLDLLASVEAAVSVAPKPAAWHPAAVRLYTNWLAYVVEQKADREDGATGAARQWRIAS